MMLEISIDWPGKFTQGKPRSHWTRRAGARDRDTSTGLQGPRSPSMQHQAYHRHSRRSVGALLIPVSELTPPTKAGTELALLQSGYETGTATTPVSLA